ncbi:hypothetical protein [Nocardia sp. CC201C]|uniref:hypothetical protein n=1 Tax=Nocardia sp. CC201C TaxID=3044575 RepID=UPI0024A92A16|nr:hypothetical protein [Nocardia sp. CC201C]
MSDKPNPFDSPFLLGDNGASLPAFAGMPSAAPTPEPEPTPAAADDTDDYDDYDDYDDGPAASVLVDPDAVIGKAPAAPRRAAVPELHDDDGGGPAGSVADPGDEWGTARPAPVYRDTADDYDDGGPAASVLVDPDAVIGKAEVSGVRPGPRLVDPEDTEAIYGTTLAADAVLGADRTTVELGEPPPPPPVPAKVVAMAGNWDDWLGRPRKGTTPTAAAADPDEDEWDIPDYDADDDTADQGYSATARRGLVDRSGSVKPVVGRLARRREDTDTEVSVYRSRSVAAAVATVAAAAVVIGTIVVVNLKMGGPTGALSPTTTAPALVPATAAPVASTTAVVPENYPHATANCYATAGDTTVVGAGPGDPATPAGVILAFEWAYYVDRSGARAREHVAPDATVPDAAAIQAGIDTVPDGTKYCVFLTRADADGRTWQVELHEQYPTDPAPQRYAQVITTRTEGGRALITAITKR